MKNYKFTLGYERGRQNGFLYNYPAAIHVWKITSHDDWIVPSAANVSTLKAYLGTSPGGKLKAINGWNPTNIGATDAVNFRAFPAGYRLANGAFAEFGDIAIFWTSTEFNSANGNCFYLYKHLIDIEEDNTGKKLGLSIRLVRAATISDPSTDGEYCDPYVGNDGQSYKTVRIGTQVWTSENLVETKYRNGSSIVKEPDATAWAALITGAFCAYDNDESSAISLSQLELSHSPAGWDEKSITFSRHEFYHSVFRSYSMSLRFVFEAVAFIMAAYETEGTNAVITIKVEAIDRDDFEYVDYYEGILDLSEMKIYPEWIECPIIDSDTLSKFVARDDMEIEMNRTETLDGSAVVTADFLTPAIINGIKIIQTLTASLELSETRSGVTSWSQNLSGTWTHDDDDIKEIIGGEISGYTFEYTNNTEKYQYLRIRITGSFVGEWDTTSTLYTIGAQLVLTTPAGYVLFNEGIDQSEGFNPSMNIPFSIDIEIPVPNENESFPGIHELEINVTGLMGIICDNGTITGTIDLNWDVIFDLTIIEDDPTITNVALPYPLFTRAIELMTENTATFDADIIDTGGDAELTAVVNGYMVRRFPFAQAPLKVVFRDLFKSFSNVFNLGFFFNGLNFELKDIGQYFKNSLIANLGEVAELQIDVANDRYFNEIRAGYERDVSHENVNGRSSTNVGFTFINSKRIKRQLDVSSPYGGDDYSIELARKKQYTESSMEDTRYDDLNFLLYCIDDPEDGLKTAQGFDTFEEISGVPAEDSRLNLDITPKRNLMRCSNRVSVAEHISENITRYLSSKTTRQLVTKKAAVAEVVEQANIAHSDLDTPLYIPEYYNFKAPVTTAIMQAIMTDPHGYFGFTHRGTAYKGFIHEVSTEPFTRNGNFTLIKTPF